MILDQFAVWYDTEQLPEGYEPVTYAWDLFNQERAQMLREATRLKEKGEDIIIVCFDTRKGLIEDLRVREDQVANKRSLYGEIWRRVQ